MKELAKKNRDKVIDVLCERLTFERAGVKLYDSIIRKMQQSKDPIVRRMIDQVKEYRDEEKEHEEWLEAEIRALGGDTNAKTEKAKLVEVESEGLGKVILDGDPDISHLFHALLTIELTDNAGWDLLVELADEADDKDAKRGFKKRLHEEEDHLTFVRRAVERFARHEVLGERLTAPPAP